MRLPWVPVLTAGLALVPAAAAAPPTNSAGRCLTPLAADGNEPVCNPFVGSAAWSTSHRGSYAQASSPYPAPHPGDEVAWQDLQFPNEIPVILQISEPYPDGRRTVWFSTVAAPEARSVYKIDYETGEVLGHASIVDEGGQPTSVPNTSGVYNLLDRDNHLITVRENGLAVTGDVQPGERTSPIKLLRKFELPRRAKCRENDRIIGITLTYTGDVAFATVQGMVGVVPREPERMTEANLVVASINGKRCDDASVPDQDLEQISNSISADDEGSIYPVSDAAQFRFDYANGRLERVWRAAYTSGGGGGGATLSSGSGSTPDVVGTDPHDDKLIAITDGQKLMHLTLFWKDEIPADWKGLPNRDRRMACEFPVTFGDPNATESISEQSVLTRGYSFVVVNNALALDRAFALIPPALRPLSALSGNLEGNGPRGMERIDWDPKTRTCHSVWANRTVSIPNAIPTMSTESGLVYGAGVQNDTWGLEGLDYGTGESKLWVPTTPLPGEDSFFAATTVGPEGDIWIGGTSGISVFRGPDRPEPKLACKDLDAPRSRIRRARVVGDRLTVRGRARDLACGLPSRSLARVTVAVRRKGGKLRFRRARLGRYRRGAYRRFVFRSRRRLQPGRVAVVIRTTDRAGNASRKGRRARYVQA